MSKTEFPSPSSEGMKMNTQQLHGLSLRLPFTSSICTTENKYTWLVHRFLSSSDKSECLIF